MFFSIKGTVIKGARVRTLWTVPWIRPLIIMATAATAALVDGSECALVTV